MPEKKSSTLIRVSGLWSNERNGKKYLSSKIGGVCMATEGLDRAERRR